MKSNGFKQRLFLVLFIAAAWTGMLGGPAAALMGSDASSSNSTDFRKSAEAARVLDQYGKLPLFFIENRGQLNGDVKFYEKGVNRATYFTKKEIVLAVSGGGQGNGPTVKEGSENGSGNARSGLDSTPVRPNVVRMEPLGMSKDVEILAGELQTGKINYCLGHDPGKWRKNIATYGSIVYKNAYPNIDLKFYGNNQKLEYDVIVHPGGDPSLVKLRLTGINEMKSTEQGDLLLGLDNDQYLLQKRPVVYQEIGGTRVQIDSGYQFYSEQSSAEVLDGNPGGSKKPGRQSFIYAFALASYDNHHPLVIDPVMFYSYKLGGTLSDQAMGIALDSSGNAYLTGFTASSDFPTENPIYPAFAGGAYDAFVTKINADGDALVYSTYLGGSGEDKGLGIAVDSAGSAYVTGYTASDDFPTENPIYPDYAGGVYDAFVTKINADGDALVYSTYLGGKAEDGGSAIAVDTSGSAYITGYTKSSDFPTASAIYSTYGGSDDAFATKINAAGDALTYSTYLGGSGQDRGRGIAVDTTGAAYLTGYTKSSNFPTQNALYPTFNGTYSDAFVTKVSSAGSALAYSTYLGGTTGDSGNGIAVDSSGNAYVVGNTQSANFPTKNALYSTYAGGMYDVFVTKFNTAGSELLYSTYLGGSQSDFGAAIALDKSGSAYVTGGTFSPDFPVVGPSPDMIILNSYVAKLDATGSQLKFSTFLGGDEGNQTTAIAVDTLGNAYVAGYVGESFFPATGALSFGPLGGVDAFVTKLVNATADFLWQNQNDLRARLWEMNEDDESINETFYGPFATWEARFFNRNADGTGRLLWQRSDDLVSLWTVNQANEFVSEKLYGPFPGWTVKSYSQNSDNTRRILWQRRTDGLVSLWKLDANDNFVSEKLYGPFSGWEAKCYQQNVYGTATDRGRILWQRTSDYLVSLWTLNALDQFVGEKLYGPFDGWSVKSYSQAPDETGRILWQRLSDGLVSLWTTDKNDSFVNEKLYSPGIEWLARNYDAF